MKNKAVLITGCDSGFGHMLAQRLDTKGLHVFAAFLSPEGPGAQKLKSSCSNRLKILKLDVSDVESVGRAFEFVSQNLEDSEFWAIVNNAGITQGSFTDISSIEDYKQCININCLGMIRVTKAFLPLLKKTRGRIVNVTSVLGRFSAPGQSPYIVSKFAATGFSDSLRLELNIWGIRVISIEPYVFRTELNTDENIDKIMDSLLKKLEPEKKLEYGQSYFDELRKSYKQIPKNISPETYMVVDAMESAIELKYPKAVYCITSTFRERLLIEFYQFMPRKMQDAIVKYKYTFYPVPPFIK